MEKLNLQHIEQNPHKFPAHQHELVDLTDIEKEIDKTGTQKMEKEMKMKFAFKVDPVKAFQTQMVDSGKVQHILKDQIKYGVDGIKKKMTKWQNNKFAGKSSAKSTIKSRLPDDQQSDQSRDQSQSNTNVSQK